MAIIRHYMNYEGNTWKIDLDLESNQNTKWKKKNWFEWEGFQWFLKLESNQIWSQFEFVKSNKVRIKYRIFVELTNQIKEFLNQIESNSNQIKKKADLNLQIRIKFESNVKCQIKLRIPSYNAVCVKFFLETMWPTFEKYKLELRGWLNTCYPEYFQEVGYREWTNTYTGRHHSLLLWKMKDLRGVYIVAIKTTIFKEFRLQVISKKNVKVIANWKNQNKLKSIIRNYMMMMIIQ